MVLSSQFVGDKKETKPRGEAAYTFASLDFMVDPCAEKKAALAQACIEHKPGRAEVLNQYFAKHGISQEAPQITVAQEVSAAPVAAANKKPGSGM